MNVLNNLNLILLTWRGKTWQMSNILGVNVWRLWVYPLQSQIISLKKSFAKFSTRLELKLMIRILNHAFVLAVKAVR